MIGLNLLYKKKMGFLMLEEGDEEMKKNREGWGVLVLVVWLERVTKGKRN